LFVTFGIMGERKKERKKGAGKAYANTTTKITV
jgi:hypothetical protein